MTRTVKLEYGEWAQVYQNQKSGVVSLVLHGTVSADGGFTVAASLKPRDIRRIIAALASTIAARTARKESV